MPENDVIHFETCHHHMIYVKQLRRWNLYLIEECSTAKVRLSGTLGECGVPIDRFCR
jgi:hypothetical protein